MIGFTSLVEAELVRLLEIDGGVLAGQRQVDALGLRLSDLGDVAREVLGAHGRVVGADDLLLGAP